MTTNGSVMISTSTNNLLLTWLFGAPYFGIPDVQGIVARGSQTNNSSLSFTSWSGKLTANHGWSVHASDLHEFVIDVSCHQCPHAHSCPVCEDWICWSIYPTGVDGSWGLVNTLDGALCLLVFTALAPGLVGLMLLGRSLDWKQYT